MNFKFDLYLYKKKRKRDLLRVDREIEGEATAIE